ncbi:Elongator subunit elp2, partial [Nowakowskiella sp. JEL0078]
MIPFCKNISVPVIFCCATDSKLSVYIYDIQTKLFNQALSLPGHTDWIRSIDVITYIPDSSDSPELGFKDGDLIIATAAQDKYIRLWKISDVTNTTPSESTSSQKTPNEETQSGELTQELLDSILNDDIKISTVQLSTKVHKLTLNTTPTTSLTSYPFVHLPANLQNPELKKTYSQPLKLVSSSADKQLMIWSPALDGVWTTIHRAGEIGGATHGFQGALLLTHPSDSALWVVGYGYTGALNFWRTERSRLVQMVGLSGHSGSVEAIEWAPGGGYVVSVGLDQTVRAWARWRRRGGKVYSWHEIGRPQVHGYDVHCVAFIDRGSDEKVVRAFEAPRTFVKSLENLTGVKEDAAVYE